MLRFFSVAEGHGLIDPRPSGENFSFSGAFQYIDSEGML